MIADRLKMIADTLPTDVTLIAVSKTHPVEAIAEAYAAGERRFGESRPQELKAKYESLPKDIEWHFIGHLQTNKVKYIAPFTHLIHSVDSVRLLEAINSEAAKIGRFIKVLLEVHIADEGTKFGWDPDELRAFIRAAEHKKFPYIIYEGLMGMATFSDDKTKVGSEFRVLKNLYNELKSTDMPQFSTLSMGMSEDYETAIAEGSNMVRIGSAIFGNR